MHTSVKVITLKVLLCNFSGNSAHDEAEKCLSREHRTNSFGSCVSNKGALLTYSLLNAKVLISLSSADSFKM